MTQRDRFLLTLVVPLLALAGVWFLLLAPQRKEAERLDTELATEQQRLSTAEGDVIRYRAAREQLADAVRDLAAVGRAVPTDAAVAALLRELSGTAERADVVFDAVTTNVGDLTAPAQAATAEQAGDAGAPAGVTTIDVTLSFEGEYFGLQRVFARLDRAVEASRRRMRATGRLLTVRELQLSREEGQLTAQVDAAIYVLPDLTAFVPAGTVPVAEPPPADPAGAQPALATATPATP